MKTGPSDNKKKASSPNSVARSNGICVSTLVSTFLMVTIVTSVSIRSTAQPRTVILIRHAEKPKKDSNHLSDKGYQRASRLPELFQVGGQLHQWGYPDIFIAAKFIPHETTMRSIETLQPLADQVGAKIIKKFHRDDFRDLAEWVLESPRTEDKVVIIAWPHSELDKLAFHLGIKRPEEWQDDVFNRSWVIDYHNHDSPDLHDIAQKLLPGD